MKNLPKTIRTVCVSIMYLAAVSAANAENLVSVVESRYIVPPVAQHQDSIGNGGFFISGYGRGGGIGNGGDENTVWFHSFHLERDQWKAFTEADPQTLISAYLSLIYTPTHSASYNDYIQISGLKAIQINKFSGFQNGPLKPRHRRITIKINLLDYYSPEEIFGVMKSPLNPDNPNANWMGNVLMRYADDATIHQARLVLEY